MKMAFMNGILVNNHKKYIIFFQKELQWYWKNTEIQLFWFGCLLKWTKIGLSISHFRYFLQNSTMSWHFCNRNDNNNPYFWVLCYSRFSNPQTGSLVVSQGLLLWIYRLEVCCILCGSLDLQWCIPLYLFLSEKLRD